MATGRKNFLSISILHYPALRAPLRQTKGKFNGKTKIKEWKKGQRDNHYLHFISHLHVILPLRLAKGCPKGGVVENVGEVGEIDNSPFSSLHSQFPYLLFSGTNFWLAEMLLYAGRIIFPPHRSSSMR